MAKETELDQNEPVETFNNDSSSLSESSAIDDLPFNTVEPVEPQLAPEPSDMQEDSTQKPDFDLKEESSTPKETKSKVSTEKPVKEDTKPIYETDPVEEQFKSKRAEEIRNQVAPKGVHAKNWNEAKSKWSAQVEEVEKEYFNFKKDHQKALSEIQKENEKLSERVKSLTGYESAVDYETSEKFQKEYEVPVKSAEDSLINFMKNSGASEDGLEELKSGIKDDRYLFKALRALEQKASDPKNPIDSSVPTRFGFEMRKIMEARQKANSALEDVRSNHDKFVSERKLESTKKSAEFESSLSNSVTEYTKTLNEDNTPAFPFLVKQRTPEGASSEQIKAIEEHNKSVEDNISGLNQIVKGNDPKEHVRMAVGYMTAIVRGQQIEQLQNLLKEKDNLISRIQASSAPPTDAKGGSLPNQRRPFEGSLSELAEVTFRS